MPYTRITALWNGAAGLPGYSRFKFAGALDSAAAATAAGRLRTFFFDQRTLIPIVVNITFSEAAQVFSDDGVLTAEVSYTPPLLVQGTAPGTYSAPVGMVVNWLTGSVSGGRKVRGRTFMVPLAGATFGTDGAPASVNVAALQASAATLLGGTPGLVIASHSEAGGSSVASVTGATVPRRAAVLRSRRD